MSGSSQLTMRPEGGSRQNWALLMSLIIIPHCDMQTKLRFLSSNRYVAQNFEKLVFRNLKIDSLKMLESFGDYVKNEEEGCKCFPLHIMCCNYAYIHLLYLLWKAKGSYSCEQTAKQVFSVSSASIIFQS